MLPRNGIKNNSDAVWWVISEIGGDSIEYNVSVLYNEISAFSESVFPDDQRMMLKEIPSRRWTLFQVQDRQTSFNFDKSMNFFMWFQISFYSRHKK